MTSAADYRAVVRRGRRATGANTVCYIRSLPTEAAVRFGFIVSKQVGIATRRNLVRRRLKAVGYSLLDGVPAGTDIVIRALPGSDRASWDSLREEISAAIDKSLRTA